MVGKKRFSKGFTLLALFALIALLAASGGCGSSSSGSGPKKADAIFFNALIYTADAEQSEASAMAVADGKILFVGDLDGAAAYELAPEGYSLDLGGRRVLPGMIDTHCHPIMVASMGRLEKQMEIDSAWGKDELLAAVKKFADDNAVDKLPIIFGLGFDTPKCKSIDKADLDAIDGKRPIFLLDSGGHFGLANSKALESVENKDFNDSDSHYFEKDQNGDYTGRMYEQGPVFRMQSALFPFDEDTMAVPLSMVIEAFNSFGLTGVFEAGASPEEEVDANDLLRAMEAVGSLDMRMFTSHFTMPFDDLTKTGDKLKELGAKTDLVRPTALKIISDGTIEACTAYMFDDYYAPGTGNGKTNYKPEQMKTAARSAADAGFGVHIHAIGDQAVSNALEVFEWLGPIDGGKTMAHCQILPAGGVEKWGKQTDVVFETTPVWLISALEKEKPDDSEDKTYTYQVLGKERFMRQSPLQSLKKAGVTITFGSDCPVSGGETGLNPLNNIWAAVNRETLGGTDIYSPKDEYLGVKDSIDAYTINAARQLKAEDEIGSLEAGKAADFVILDKDILSIDPLKVHGPLKELFGDDEGVFVLSTYLGGKLVYEKK